MEENKDAENYGKEIDLDEINELNKNRLKSNTPQEEIKVIEEPKYIEEPKEIPKEDPIPPVTKREIIKEFNNKPETKQYDAKLIPNSKMLGIWIFMGLLILILLIGMIWGNTLKSKFLDKDFSPIINNNIAQPNVSFTDAGTTENTYTINNYNNFTILNNVTVPNIIVEVNST